MRDQPTGEALLHTARGVVLDTLLPALPAERRHDALMVANAIAIALRQWQNGSTPERAELDALTTLLGLPPADAGLDGAALHTVLLAANRHCCEALRSGRLAASPAVWSLLCQVVRHKVAESNPKALPAGAVTR